MKGRHWALLMFLLIVALVGTACGGAPGNGPGAAGRGAGVGAEAPVKPVDLNIFAAASLAGAFSEAADHFTAQHRSVQVYLNFAGSQQLATQIEQGAGVDVFAAADNEQMDRLLAAGLVTAPRVFAQNSLVLIVPAANPAGIASLRDLARPHRLVLAAPAVPVGKYARGALAALGATAAYGDECGTGYGDDCGADFAARALANVVSEETDVKQVAVKVALGEADAGIVYATDAAALGDRVLSFPFPPIAAARAAYPIAATRDGQTEWAARWLAFIFSPAGQEILRAHGFSPAAAAVAP